MRPGTGLRTLRGTLAVRLLAACLAFAVPAASHAAPGDTPETRARRAIDGFVAGFMARHPEEAARLGDHSRDDALPDPSASARALEAAWYRAQLESLTVTARTPLSPALAIDLRLVLGRATREVRAREAAGGTSRDPANFLDPLHAALTDPLRSFHASSCTRATALRHRLRAVPEYLRDTRIVLQRPDRIALEYALDRVALLLHRCRVETPDAFGSCREARLQADLAEADSVATGALVRFADHLRDPFLRDATSAPGPRPGRLAEQLEAVGGEPVALDSLFARLRDEWSGLAAAAADPEAGPVDAARIDADSAEVLFEGVRRELAKAGEVPGDAVARIEVRDRPPLRAMDAVTSLGPWDPRGARSRLELGPRPLEDIEWSGGAIDEDPMRSRVSARLALARDGLPGRAWFAAAEARLGSRGRQAFGLDPIRDGWSRYAESVWLGTRSEPEREQASRVLARLERARLARAIAELVVALEGDGVERAARWLEESAGLPSTTARRVALEAAESPRWAASALARDRFRALRAEAERRLGDHFDAARFHAAVIREGAVPTAWVAETILTASAGSRGRRP